MVFHWDVSDNKSPQVSRTLFSILADLNNIVFWMVLSSYFQMHQSLYQSFGDCTGCVNNNSYHRHFHVPCFFQQSLCTYLTFHLPLVLLSGQPEQQSSQFGSFSCFFLTVTSSGRLSKIRWFVCILKSQRILCVSFSWTDSGLCIYHWFVWSNLNFLHNSQWITFPAWSSLVLYPLSADLPHSLVMGLIVSSLPQHNLHLQFCCILYILVLMELVCAAIWRDSVSLLRLAFLSHIEVFPDEISLVCCLKHP